MTDTEAVFTIKFANPASEIGALVARVLSPPTMAFAGGSATEERAIDRWKVECTLELQRLRTQFVSPGLAPDAYLFLDVVAKILRVDGRPAPFTTPPTRGAVAE